MHDLEERSSFSVSEGVCSQYISYYTLSFCRSLFLYVVERIFCAHCLQIWTWGCVCSALDMSWGIKAKT